MGRRVGGQQTGKGLPVFRVHLVHRVASDHFVVGHDDVQQQRLRRLVAQAGEVRPDRIALAAVRVAKSAGTGENFRATGGIGFQFQNRLERLVGFHPVAIRLLGEQFFRSRADGLAPFQRLAARR